MEHNDLSRRPYPPRSYTAQQQQPVLASTSGQYGNPGDVERFRQPAYLQDAPSTPQSTLRGSGDAQQAYGFAQGGQYGAGPVLQPSALQYGQEIQTPESQRQQQQQPQYQPYGSHVVYGMGQQPQGAQQSPYDPVTQYRSRASTASDTMVGSQFGVPPAAQYYLPGQPTHPNTSAPDLASQYTQQNAYAQAGPSTGSGYMMDPSQSTQYSYVQQPQYQSQPQPPQQSTDQELERYGSVIRTIFSSAKEGSLRDVSGHLLDASKFLLGNAETLGLIRDDVDLYAGRLKLWHEFNRAWLATLQRQVDMTQEMLQTGQQPRAPYSIMGAPALEQLGNELVRLCDVIEKHGLVDYEMGVEEEQIMELLVQCLSLLEPRDELRDDSGAQAQSSAAGAMRGR